MVLENFRYGLRLLRRNPAFSAAAVTVMALGIGATTAVFTVVRAVLLQPLPYQNPEQLVILRADAPGFVQEPALSMEEFRALSSRTDVFAQIASIIQSEASFTGVEDMEAVNAASVSDGFFDVLGISPIAGRHLSAGLDGGKTVRGASISYELWHRRWKGEATLVGRTVEINNLEMVIVGVLPPGLRVYLGPGTSVPQQVDVWFPQLPVVDAPRFRGWPTIARLRPELPMAATQAALDAFVTTFVAANPSSYSSGAVRLSLVPLDDDVVSGVRPALLAFAAAVAFVLLVACANVTHLLLARVSARTGELSVRRAVGATRRHLVTQLAVESLLLGGLGTVAGLLVAEWVLGGLMQFAPATMPRRDTIGIDGEAALFAVAVSMACTIVFGLVPAYRAADTRIADLLKHRSLATRHAGVSRGFLIGGQIALSLILLVAAGLMARAFLSMRTVALGFEPANVLTMRVNVQFQRFSTADLRRTFFTAAADEIRRLPGVASVALGSPIPLSDVRFTQRFATGPGETEHTASTLVALPGFFDALGVRLVAGRTFGDADSARRDPQIVVDRRLADRLWPGEDAVGKRLFVGPAAAARSNEVIGVVETLRLHSVRDEPPAQIWQAYAARPGISMGLVIRTSGDPRALAETIRRTVERLQPGRPVSDVRLLSEYVADATADTRFALFVLGAFAVLALILTAVGIYGVVAYATARRSHEIAVRLALGGDVRRVVAVVIRDTVAWALAGVAAGLAGATILTRYLESLLFEVNATDPLTFAAVGSFIIVVALVATGLPALRAVRADPMQTLRAD
jgi:putative ABC transport system permease protein